MSVSVVETNDPLETEALGAELAAGLRDGDVVLVRGELGSGKTTFVRGAARALGVTDPITSPTFSIGHRYRATQTRPSPTSISTAWRTVCRPRIPACWMTIWVPGRIAFVEWPVAGQRRALERARARDADPSGRRSPADRGGAGMIVLGFDTATRSTAVALRLADGSTLQARDDPGTGRASRTCHATAGQWRTSCWEARVSAGARSSGSPLGWGRAPSRACAWGSRPRAGWRSRWGWSWSGLEPAGARRAGAASPIWMAHARHPRGPGRTPRRGVCGCV